MKLRLLTKMLLSILVPATLGLALVATVSHQMSGNALRLQTRQDMGVILKSQEAGLNAVFLSMREALAQLTENRRLHLLLAAYNKGEAIGRDNELFLRALDALKNFTTVNSNIATCGLVAADGKVIAHSKKGDTQKFSATIGLDFSKRPYVIRGMRGETSSVGLVSVATKKMTTIIGMPVREDGKVVGVIYGGTDNSHLAANTTNKVDLGDAGHAFVVNMDGIIVQHPDPARIGQSEIKAPWMERVLRQKNGRLEFVDAGGREKVLYFMEMPEEGWILCLDLDKRVVNAPISAMLANNVLLALGCALAVAIVIFFSIRGMARLLGGLSGMANAIAGGCLECGETEKSLLRAAERRGDEFSTLAAGMERMMGNIKRLLGESAEKTTAAERATEQAHHAAAQAAEAAGRAESAHREGMLAAAEKLEGVAGVFSSASAQLAEEVEMSERAASESARQLEESAAAMQQMNVSLEDVARNAAAAAATSEETRTSAESGASIVRRALQSIGEVQKVSRGLQTDMEELNGHAQAISRIMSVISDIADQTNLLALNAAIEAARAGDAGRGFAVVADEVRKLAEKTVVSTNDVGKAIEAIQASTAKSVAAVDDALRQVETAADLAGQSGEALQHIVGGVELTADQVRAIAGAGEQQSASSKDINQSIVKINDISRQTAKAMEEAAMAVADLSRQARKLDELIAEMKRG